MSNLKSNFKIFLLSMQEKNELQISNLTRSEFQQLKPVLIEIYFSAYQGMPAYAYNRRRSVKSYLDWLYKGDPEGFFVARIGRETVGFVSCHANWEDYREGRVCEVHEFVVKKEYQGKGIGKALMNKVIDYALSMGHKKLTLWVGEGNEKAINLYLKMGFKPLYKAGIWLRMKKDL